MRNRILTAAILAAAAAGAAPAFAQTTEQLTVTGQWNGRGEPPQSLSRVVSYADLDLRQAADQETLRRRVRSTAADICNELGEKRPDRTNLGRSCEENAVRGAEDQVKFAVAQAMNGKGGEAHAAAVSPVAPPSAEGAGQPASFTTTTVTNGPIPDTPENRAKYGGPMSKAGRMTKPAGN
jgi:UrcA family protein